jgi:hypothetical protein
LRSERRAAVRAAPDRDLHQRIMAQSIEVDRILVAASDRRCARHHHLKHCVEDAIGIASIRHRLSKPSANTELALRLAQQQQPGVAGLVAARKIDCEFLAVDGWQVEWKQRIVGHGGCGAALIPWQLVGTTICLCESATSHHSRRKKFSPHA